MRIWVIGWMLIAFAASVCPTGNAQQPSQQQVLVLLQQAFGYHGAGEKVKASDAVAEILQACGADGKPNAPPANVAIAPEARKQFILLAIALDRKLENFERANTTLDVIGPPESVERLQAEGDLLYQQIYGQQGGVGTAIELMARSTKAIALAEPPQGLLIRNACQPAVVEAIVEFYRVSNVDMATAETQVKQIQQQMIDQGVEAGVAALCRIALARRYVNLGSDEKLENILDRLQNIVANEEQITDYCRALYWNLRATLHVNRHQYFDAFDACRQFELFASRIDREDRRESQVAVAGDQAALVAIKIGDYEEAKRSLQATEAANSKDLRKSMEWRINMATALAGGDAIIDARDTLQAAAEQLAQQPAAPADLVATVDNNLGLVHYLEGDFEAAAERMKRTLRSVSGVRFAEASVNAGWIAWAEGDVTAAREHFTRAMQEFGKGLKTDSPRYAESLCYLARIAAEQHDFQQAQTWIRKAEDLDFRRVCHDLSSAGSSRDRIALVQEARVHPESIAWPGAIDTYLELAPVVGISANDQYEVVLRWKGLISRFEELIGDDDDNENAEEGELRKSLEVAYFNRPGSSLRLRAWQRELDQLETKLRDVRRKQRAGRRELDPQQARPKVDEIARTLQTGELLFDVFQIRSFRRPEKNGPLGSSQQYLAFTLQPDGTVNRLSLGNATDVDNAIQNWTFEITQSESLQATRFAERAATVATLIQKPLLDSKVEFDRLLIRGDGATHWVPWAALPGSDGKGYWIQQKQIQICNNVPISADAKDLPNQPSLLAVGGVEFGDLKKIYPPLEGTRVEKNDVETIFRNHFAKPQIVDLEGKQADKVSLLRELAGKQYVHLATHGFYQRRDEANVFGVNGAMTLLQSGIVLAPSLGQQPVVGKGDQFLTAAEIRQTDLSQARLVMLSACESGLGKVQAGQGVAGMLGSFHAAGANRVIGTLWKVSDAGTAKIVDRFYKKLWNDGMTPADALRAAQLEMIQMGATQKNIALDSPSNPAVWAAFFCSAQ